MSKTKIQIIDETVEFYSVLGRRSVNPEVPPEATANRCLYNGPDGKHCAFARVVENPEVLEENANAGYLLKEKENRIKFKDGYEGHDGKFWLDIQSLHDSDNNWGEGGGLTPKGKERVEAMKLRYADS